MATKGKESPFPKEKRVTSSSQNHKTNTLQKGKSPNTSKQSSPIKTHNSFASEKHIPNYLKPTISSGLDSSNNHIKKNVSGDSKSNFTRRRSFEKPLLPPPIQKASTSSCHKERSLKSSSFTIRSTTSHKPLPDRLLKSPRDIGKGTTVYGRPVGTKKSNTNIKSEEKESSSIKEHITSIDIIDTLDTNVIAELGPHQEDFDASSTQDDEHILNLLKNDEIITEFLLAQDDSHMNLLVPDELDNHEFEGVKMIGASMEGSDESTSFHMEKQEEITKVEEGTKEHINADSDEKIISKDQVEDEEVGEENPKENIEQEMDKKVEGNEGSNEDVKLQEIENEEEHDKEMKNHVDNEETKQEVIQGKKESSVSNDVIEETATKLREQRKNKVKALAGAFETVISLQDPK